MFDSTTLSEDTLNALERKAAHLDADITHDIREMGFWVKNAEIDLTYMTFDASMGYEFCLTQVDRIEARLNTNINHWYMVMGELIMRRFTMVGGYVGEMA